MQQHSTSYIFMFAAGVCLVCSVLVSFAAVALRERQEANQLLDRKRSVLQASQMIQPEEGRVSPEEIRARFNTITTVVVDTTTGEVLEDMDPAAFDPAAAPRRPAPQNPAQVREIPEQAAVFQVMKDGAVDMIILPIQGTGLWGMMHGYIALDSDTRTVRGITFYEHIETPGLGGEVDNPRWKGRWPDRKIFDEDWNIRIEVIKGAAGAPPEDPHRVDGLSGATITSRGVTNMLHFWLGENGFGPYLEKFRQSRSA